MSDVKPKPLRKMCGKCDEPFYIVKKGKEWYWPPHDNPKTGVMCANSEGHIWSHAPGREPESQFFFQSSISRGLVPSKRG